MKTMIALLFIALPATVIPAAETWTISPDKTALFGVDRRLSLSIDGAGQTPFTQLQLVCDGHVLGHIEFVPARHIAGEHTFVLKPTEQSRAAWAHAMMRGGDAVPIRVLGVDASGRSLALREFELKRARDDRVRAYLVWGLIIALALAVVWLGAKTNLLRDSGPEPETGRRPFSLSRVQMAIWTVVVIGSFLYVWRYFGEPPPLNQTVLALLGIATGTSLGARLISVSKRPDAIKQLAEAKKKLAELTAQGATPDAIADAQREVNRLEAKLAPQQSEGFLRDIVSDDDGVSLHRFQLLAWTIVLVIIFVSYTRSSLALREFDTTLLALMGISSGFYLGFKLPE